MRWCSEGEGPVPPSVREPEGTGTSCSAGGTGALVFVEGQQPRWALAVPQSRGGQVSRERALGTSLSFCAPSRRGCAGARGASPCSGRKSRWLDRVCALRAGRDSRASGPVPV